MSQVYSTEPQTSGSVVFETTHGPLSVHLWCKECPYTVRFFLQLCIDGFYDGLVFHRIIPNFLIQTGDAQFRQTGDNDNESTAITPWKQPPPKKYREQHQAAQALDRRQYELNSRIRFNHRGQIAMALGIDDNLVDESGDKSFARLQPQFFITLEEASHLDGKHVCFGGISGPTIFNALRIGQTDIFNSSNEDDDRNFQPRILFEAPRILKTKILDVDLPPTLPALAPTQDRLLLPWSIDPKAGASGKESKKRKKKNRKGVKNMNLLSFGEEMNDEEGNNKDEPNGKSKKIQSSHDVLASKSLSKKKTEIKQRHDTGDNQNTSFETPNHDEAISAVKNQTSTTKDEDDLNTSISLDSSNPPVPTFSSRKVRIAVEETKDNVPDYDHSASDTMKKKEKSKKISLVEARRAKYAKKNSNRKGSTKQRREGETMLKFKAFQQKMTATIAGENRAGENDSSTAPAAYHGQILERDVDGRDWITTKFKCKKHMDHDAKTRGGDGRGIDDYEVIEERSSATDRKPGKRKRHRPRT
jgi:peptidyl-prolyl cis-trans isomerase SDCCAG10